MDKTTSLEMGPVKNVQLEWALMTLDRASPGAKVKSLVYQFRGRGCGFTIRRLRTSFCISRLSRSKLGVSDKRKTSASNFY